MAIIKKSGFTLLEILIVLFIVSIVTTVALLTIHRNEKKEMEAFTIELTQMISLANEEALLQPAVLGLYIGKHAIQFYSLKHDVKEHKHKWLPVNDSALGKYDIPNNMQVSVKTLKNSTSHEDDEKKDPQIIISTNGDMTPFTIYIGKKSRQPSYAIIGEANGHITNKSLQ